MKNIFIISVIMAIMAAIPQAATGQSFYKGELSVTGTQYRIEGKRMKISLTVSFAGLKLPSDESITIMPLLKGIEKEFSLPSILINGNTRQKVYEREINLSPKKTVAIPAVVITNDPSKSRVFKYEVDIPFDSWMPQSTLYLRTQECSCHGKTGKLYEESMGTLSSYKLIPGSTMEDNTAQRYLNLVNFVEPVYKDTLFNIGGTILYYDPTRNKNQFGDQSVDKQNFEVYSKLKDALNSINQDAHNNISRIRIIGYGAPIGNIKKNDRNSFERAMSLKSYLRDNLLPEKSLEVDWVTEDWSGIAAKVKSSDMLLRDAAMDIINNIEVDRGRERMLNNLGDGRTQAYMEKYIYPYVKRITYDIEYTRSIRSMAENLSLLRGGNYSLSLQEFYLVAKSYPVGSKEYNDILDLSARLFPDSPEANINAAAVALIKGDPVKARNYIERFSTHPSAYNNMGILCLAEGNIDKAEVYLSMAKATGLEQASRTLSGLRK